MNTKSSRFSSVGGGCTALAAATAALFGLAAPSALAEPPPDPGLITSCDDTSMSGVFGTLRYAAANVPDGGTIDLRNTPCNKIFLNFANGDIVLQQSTVTILGPGKGAMEIEGRWNHNCYSDGQPIYCPAVNRVFHHTGTGGKLTIKDMTLSHGVTSASVGTASGGCVSSAGSLYMYRVDVHDCTATQTAASQARGGALYAHDKLRFKYGSVTASTVTANNGGIAWGGGAYANEAVSVVSSTVSGNTTGGIISAGGGVASKHSLYLINSTVSGNQATYAGGVYGGSTFGGPALDTDKFHVFNSTISGNFAAGFAGGALTRVGDVSIVNSTITQNTSGAAFEAAGLTIYVNADGHSVSLYNSILAQNYAGLVENDLYTSESLIHPLTIGGTRNLIGATFGNAAPADTSKLCPRLGPLRDNGGPTWTHALLSGSPAIDAADNGAGFAEDQRGYLTDSGPPYPYPRMSNGVADIGAYEVQQDDIVFSAAFDGCAGLAFAPPPD